MREYHKIHTVFKRDMDNKGKTLLEGQFSLPEFEYLANNKWTFTEKVDGTNIRVMWRDGKVSFGGKTDRASIQATLVDRLTARFPAKAFADVFDGDVCLYGEGYGARIQKGGGNYRPDQDFVLFDVRIGDWWLQRSDVENIACKMGIDVVPVVGSGTLYDCIKIVRDGLLSRWGSFNAEGIVARPTTELFARNGTRIITKIKERDFPGE
jgi:hypothetical protein